jgi:DNA invertase Pin-like site-specific DNA recombinase
MKKAFAYLRVSGKGQVSGDGFTRQLEVIKQYAAKHDLKITQVFQEKGVTGTREWDNRKAFVEMMALLLSNGVHTVLVESLGRLARDLMVQESIIADFKRKGLTLISVSEPDMGADDPGRVFIRQVLGAFHQYDKALLVAKLKGARIRIKARTGRCEGRKPYSNQEVIARIVAMRGKGMVLDTIAAQLNAEGIEPHSGTRWFPMSVSRVLRRAKLT